MKFNLILIWVIVLTTSCAVSKTPRERVTLAKCTKLVKIDKKEPHELCGNNSASQAKTYNYEISMYKLSKKCRVEMLATSKGVEINPMKKNCPGTPIMTTTVCSDKVDDFKNDNYYRLPFYHQYNGMLQNSPMKSELLDIVKTEGFHEHSETIQYNDMSFLYQAITFPFKYRSPITDLDNDRFLDYEISTSFNAGYILGTKLRRKSIGAVFNSKTNKVADVKTYDFGINLGLFAGLTTIKFTQNNVINPLVLENDRTVLGWTYGGALMGSFNNFTIGVAIGWDRPFGTNDEIQNWYYTGEPWLGLTLGFDILK